MAKSAQYHLNQAHKYRSDKQWRSAIEHYQQAIALQPHEPLLYCELAESEIEIGASLEAIDHLQTALKLSPPLSLQAYAQWLLGRAYESRGWGELAFSAYEQSINTDPDSFAVSAHIFLGDSYVQRKQYQLARSAYRRALNLGQEQPLLYHKIWRTMLIEADLDGLLELLAQLKEENQDWLNADDINDLATEFLKRGNEWQARELLQEAIMVDPACAPAHCNLGNIFYQNRDFWNALLAYKEATDIDPNFAEAYNNLGITLIEINRLTEAIACLEAALALKPNWQEAQHNLDRAIAKMTS
jgi:protein O-GlcNAc transferase